MKNLGTLDRMVRLVTAEACILVAIFWRSGAWQLFLIFLAIIITMQALTGRCGLYGMLGWNTCEKIKRKDKNLIIGTIVAMLVMATLGSYASIILTNKFFVDDLGSVNEPYRLTLIDTGKGLGQESLDQFEKLNQSFEAFQGKYTEYRPIAISSDKMFSEDLQNLSVLINGAGEHIRSGNLAKAHSDLETGSTILPNILKRSGLEQII